MGGASKKRQGEVARVGKNLEAGGVELMDKVLGFMEPTEAMSTCSIVIHVSGIYTDSRYLVNMVIPRIHSNTEEEDRESSAHVDPGA